MQKASITLLSTTLIFGGCAAPDGQGGWGSKQTAETAIGTVLGAIIGAQFGSGSGKTVAAIVGALADGMLTNSALLSHSQFFGYQAIHTNNVKRIFKCAALLTGPDICSRRNRADI